VLDAVPVDPPFGGVIPARCAREDFPAEPVFPTFFAALLKQLQICGVEP
jgi:hypothetical protein